MKSPSKSVHHASRSEMRALEPTFTLSLAHLPESQINRSLVAQALQDAQAMGEDCDFYCAIACPETRRVMYVLNVRSRSDTQLIYASSTDGGNLVAKAYWSGFGGWSD